MSASDPSPRQLPWRKRVLVAKPGLDGHDRGAKVIARLLRDEGWEVIYTGLRQRPETIARVAADEDVSVIGLSVLSGAHSTLVRSLMGELEAVGIREEVDVVVGGTVPPADVDLLQGLGVAAVFNMDSSIEDVRDWFRRRSQ